MMMKKYYRIAILLIFKGKGKSVITFNGGVSFHCKHNLKFMCKCFQCSKSNYKYVGKNYFHETGIFTVKQYCQYVCSMKKVLVLLSVLNVSVISLYIQDILVSFYVFCSSMTVETSV